jgi:hypothetical protein
MDYKNLKILPMEEKMFYNFKKIIIKIIKENYKDEKILKKIKEIKKEEWDNVLDFVSV